MFISSYSFHYFFGIHLLSRKSWRTCCTMAMCHATSKNSRPAVLERQVSDVDRLSVRGLASSHEVSFVYVYDAPVFSNVNRFNNILIRLSKTRSGAMCDFGSETATHPALLRVGRRALRQSASSPCQRPGEVFEVVHHVAVREVDAHDGVLYLRLLMSFYY